MSPKTSSIKPNRKQPLKSLDDVSADTLKKVLKRIIAAHPELAAEVNAQIAEMGTKTTPKSRAATHDQPKKRLSPEVKSRLIAELKDRFDGNMKRHEGVQWKRVLKKLEARKDKEEKWWSLNEMERNGHEPDVVDQDNGTGEYFFFSCSGEAPLGHRNIVYDRAAEDWLKENHPRVACKGNAVDIAAAMGIEMLDEEQYMKLQSVGKFDRKTWSWVKTPPSQRITGRALHGYRGDGHVGVYGGFAYVQSSLRTRGFRGALRV